MRCWTVRGWLDRDSAELDEGERLVLDDHLQQCEPCRIERARFALARRVVSELPRPALGPRGHARAIAGALMAGPQAVPIRRTVPRWTFAIAAAAVLTAAVVLVVGSSGDAGAPSRDTTASPPEHIASPPPHDVAAVPEPEVVPDVATPPRTAIVDGVVLHGGRRLGAGAELPADAQLRAPARAVVGIGEARVIVGQYAVVRWAPIDRVLLLDRGKLDLETTPAKAVRIRLDGYTVDILGQAALTTTTVSVRSGTATVHADGKVVAELGAGDSWRVPEPTTAAAHASASTQLEQARIAYAAGEHALAEERARSALNARPTRAQAAEAHLITAEVARATGRVADAITRYERIAADYADLSAGETALFAAARLHADGGDASIARGLLEQYLERHPSGRFADDARRLLSPR